MPTIGLVADDLTGACDSALPFLGGGAVRVALWPGVPDGKLACAAVSTESRAAGPEVSYARSREAARRLRCDLLYRKLDSMLRGNAAEDLRGVLDVVGGPCAVAPALPAEGRFTVGGVQLWPGGRADLRTLFGQLAGRVDLRDARTEADLDSVAGEILARADRVAAGTNGLASALARALGWAPAPPAPRARCRRPLAVVGSPAAAGQAAHAREHGWEVCLLGPGELPDLDGFDGLVLTGGETAARVLAANGGSSLDLLGAALPRAPLCRVADGRLKDLPVVLKAGAFGPADAVRRALEALSCDAA